MTPEFIDNPLYFSWPFWVLDLTPDSNSIDIEKSARDITGKMKLEMPGAGEYAIPGGSLKRDEFLVREAKSRLQDPKYRLLAEYWYISPDLSHGSTGGDKQHSIEDWYRDLGVHLWVV